MNQPTLLSLSIPIALSLSLACAVADAAVAGGGSVRLTAAGRPATVIVVAEEAPPSVRFAALELQDQIGEITGATLPIGTEPEAGKPAVYVGDSAAARRAGLSGTPFGEQEYAVRFVDGGILLAGLDAPGGGALVYEPARPEAWQGLPGFWEEHGTLWAVYDFLERFCGVRYFNPTEFGASFPRNPDLVVTGETIRRRPFFRYREAYPNSAFPERTDELNTMWRSTDPEFGEWVQKAYPALAGRLGRGPVFDRARRNLAHRYLLRSRNGGILVRANHSLEHYPEYFHTPDSPRFIASHPEWFAQGWGPDMKEQLCLTSTGLVDQVAHEADLYFRGRNITDTGHRAPHWGADNFAVVPRDNEFHCRCKSCAALLKPDAKGGRDRDYSSDLVFSFVNRVAQQVGRTHPGKTVSALAYSGYVAPPSFSLEPNVAVHFCWDNHRGEPEASPTYIRMMEYLKQWSRLKPGRGLYLWLYYTFPLERAQGGNYHCFPAFFGHVIGRQFKLFHELGVKGMFHCGYGQEIESYLTFRLMDDPTLDVEPLLSEYFSRQFGPAGRPMRQFYETIEAVYQDPANHPADAGGAEQAWAYQGTSARMQQLQALIDEARTLASESPYRENVALWDAGVWRYMREGAAMYRERMAAPMPEIAVPRVAAADGRVEAVDWDAAVKADAWFDFGGGRPATRAISCRMAHDDRFLYLELSDPCDTGKLESPESVFATDTWEMFLSHQRGKPYRQYAFGPTGKLVCLSHGEINFRNNVVVENPGIRLASETLPGLWRSRLALPLAGALQHPVSPGESLYVNVVRVASRGIEAPDKPGQRFNMSSLVSFSTVHDPVRAAKLTLEAAP